MADSTVFVVDDDPAVRDSLKVFLESHGLAVRDFASADDFLAIYDGGDKGCLVLDVHMPALGGFELVDALLQRRIALPTVLITGRVDRTMRQRAAAAGVSEVVEKPFDGAMLLQAIARAVPLTTAARRP